MREMLDAGDVPRPFDMPCPCAGTDAGGAIGREARGVRCQHGGERRQIKPGEAFHREARSTRCRVMPPRQDRFPVVRNLQKSICDWRPIAAAGNLRL
jgi:hypothetical protein